MLCSASLSSLRRAGFQPAWRPGWPPSQAGSPPHPLPGRLVPALVFPDERGLAWLQLIVKRASVFWPGPQSATIVPGQSRAGCDIQPRTSPGPPFSGQGRVPVSTPLHTARVRARVPGPDRLKESQGRPSGNGAAGRQAMPESDPRFLDAEGQPHWQQKKTQSRVGWGLVSDPFCLSQPGPTFNRPPATDVQNKGVEQQAGGGRTRFEGEV